MARPSNGIKKERVTIQLTPDDAKELRRRAKEQRDDLGEVVSRLLNPPEELDTGAGPAGTVKALEARMQRLMLATATKQDLKDVNARIDRLQSGS